MSIHLCGQCNQQFQSESSYLKHQCTVTGFTPVDQEHLGPEFKAISDSAVQRGEERKLAAAESGVLSAINMARKAK